MKKILKDYFTFSKKESRALIMLLAFIGVFILLPYFIPDKKDKPILNEALQQQVAPIIAKDSFLTDKPLTEETLHETEINKSAYELFEFNPNTIDVAGWKKLGLRDKTIKTILNYRDKGGRFKTAEDIRKIWGLKKEEADRIVPYVRIDNIRTGKVAVKNFSSKADIKIDINAATPQEWFTIPTMDRSLVYRIIKYKEKLGGFLAIQQVKETYGLTDSVYKTIEPYLILQTAAVKKININTADDYILSMHPYISKDVAKAITIYRTQHGAYTKVEDIKKIVFIKEELYQKIAPYLAVE
jgi:competence protein ComEA